MKIIRPISIFLLLISNLSLFAQLTAGLHDINCITVPLNPETAYKQSLSYLHNNDFFILSLDKSSGFIQAKKYIEINKVFSSKAGERLTLNFLITSVSQEESKITLVIYKETRRVASISGKDISTSYIHYYEDNGISTDLLFYERILEELEESIEINIMTEKEK